jgi:hypothetical protein
MSHAALAGGDAHAVLAPHPAGTYAAALRAGVPATVLIESKLVGAPGYMDKQFSPGAQPRASHGWLTPPLHAPVRCGKRAGLGLQHDI